MHGLEYHFHPTRKWRFDAAFPSAKVALEIEGGVWQYGRHNRASGFLKDMEKYNEAAALGWRVIRTPWEWIEDGSIVPKVVAAILHEDGDDINGDLQ
jgi:very-short-patch-repair endonuclease